MVMLRSLQKGFRMQWSKMHPTYWKHPKFSQTVKEYANGKPVYKSNEEIRKIAPECFA
jgi:hypothetical protein